MNPNLDDEQIEESAIEADAFGGDQGSEEEAVPAGGATIVVKRAGVETEEKFTFVPPAIIGRFDASVGPVDIDLGALPEGAYVSRKHAKVSCEDGVWSITDMGSSNGTYVLREDFEKVDEAELVDGTEFALGNARFVIRIPGPEPSEAP
ncbi:MAG: FHA domain-containing protein [Chthonomonadaceae bacterium]|nr:FHA domain-containing protein [Chthonomonadaceae bacterium]